MSRISTEGSPPEVRGRYLGISQASWGLGWAVAPLVFLPLHARLPEPVFWGLLGLATVPAALLTLHLDRRADRPELLRGKTAA